MISEGITAGIGSANSLQTDDHASHGDQLIDIGWVEAPHAGDLVAVVSCKDALECSCRRRETW